MRKTSGIILAAAVLLSPGCRPGNDKIPKVESSPPQASLPPAGSTSTNDRASVVSRLSAELNELDAKMVELKAKAQQAGEQVKAEWEVQRPRLEAQRNAAAQKLEELKAASKEVWDETRTRTEVAFNEVRKGFKEAWAKLKE